MATLQLALAEERRIEPLVELDAGDLDHGVRAGGKGRHLDVVRDGDSADRLDVALNDPLLRLGLVLVELEPARYQVVAPEPDEDLLVAGVLALRSLLDRVGGRAGGPGLAHALPAAAVEDGELHLLVAIIPVARGVVEGLAAVEDLARGLVGAGGAGEREDDGEGGQAGAHMGRAHTPAPPPSAITRGADPAPRVRAARPRRRAPRPAAAARRDHGTCTARRRAWGAR